MKIASALLSVALGTLTAPCSGIISGADVEPGRFPYFTSLMGSGGAHECGGSLIAPDLIITSASCFPIPVAAQIGYEAAANLGESIGIVSNYTHPSWSPSTGSYDLMIVKLESPSTAQWVTVNSDPAFPPENPAVEIDAIGIGQTSYSATGLATTLQQIPLIAIVDEACNILIQVSEATGPLFRNLPSDQMCLTDYSVGMDGQCTGDEGGPMVETGETVSDDTIVGVMAMNSGSCAASGASRYPTKGTQTSLAYDWIKTTVCGTSMDPPAYFGCPARQPTPAPVASTSAPETDAPSSAAAPETAAPVTAVPATSAPVTAAPVTSAPVTAVPATSAPVTATPVTAAPVTAPVTVSTPTGSEENCSARGADCEESLECCSGRCMMNKCQAYLFQVTRSSLRGPGRGGAAGAAVDVGLGSGTGTVNVTTFGVDPIP